MHANAQTENSSCRSQEVHIQNNIFTNAGGESVSFMRKADYIGSFLVTGSAHLERADIVRQKLEAARAYTQSKPILLAISLHGIKVCDENGSSVHMAHTLRRISYATCDPDSCQFAFLAREPKAQPNIQYCHAFVTKTPQEAESLNTLVGEAFRIAYAQQRALIESRRRSSNNQTQTASAAAAVAKEIAPPVATNPVPEPGDSGIATTEDSASLHRRSCSGKAELMGYHMAADSGLSSAESASRGVKPCFSDTDEVDPGDSDVDEKEKGKRQGETRLENEQDGNAEYDCGQLQPRCRQPFKDTATPTLEKNGKSSRLDALLNGGLLTGEIAEVFGRSAVGKTQVCHHLVASLVVSSTASSNFSNKSGATALYLDTKGDFDASRLRGLIQSLLAAKCNPQEANDLDQRINHCLDRVRHQLVPDVQELMDGLVETRLLVASSLSSESSHLSPEEALFYSNLRLVIVDCIASPFSPYVGAFTNETNFYLHSVATELRRIAVDFHIAVLLTNNLRHGEEVPKGCLGDFWVTVPHLSLFMSPLEEGRSVCVEIQQNCRTACVGNDDGDGESQTEKSPDSCVIDLFKV